MTLTAPVVGVREVPAGTSVGYGHACASRRTRLALLPVGYADGVPRARVRPRRACCCADVDARWSGWCRWTRWSSTSATAVRLGDIATVFGPGRPGEPTVAEWAGWAGTIEHEIVTGIGARVERR